jgi:hypothetical protein
LLTVQCIVETNLSNYVEGIVERRSQASRPLTLIAYDTFVEACICVVIHPLNRGLDFLNRPRHGNGQAVDDHLDPGHAEGQRPSRQGSSMPLKLPPYVRQVRNKIGRPYLYFQRGRGTARAGGLHRLPDDPKSPEFWEEYARISGLPVQRPSTRSVAALVAAWQASPEWHELAPKTQEEYTRYCARIIEAWGPLEVAGIEPRHVLMLRDRYAATPAAANHMIRTLGSMLSWSVPRGWRPDNPCRDVPHLKIGEGYEPWPWDVTVEARQDLAESYPPLSRAIWLSLYTGQRAGDTLAMRWDAVRDGHISVHQLTDGRLNGLLDAEIAVDHAVLAHQDLFLFRLSADRRRRRDDARINRELAKRVGAMAGVVVDGRGEGVQCIVAFALVGAQAFKSALYALV